MDNDNKKPEWYYPFCFKIIICENSPTEYKAKGLLDRSFKIKTYKGYPQYDIKEIRNPQGNKTRQKQLDEIEDLRKLLLVFKLFHRDPIPEIDIGIDGRDKELCKPLLLLFYNTESQKEIEETLQYFIDIKNERKKQSLEAQIYPIVVKAISEIGNRIQTRKMWDLIIPNFDGQIDEKNESLFYSTEYGKIYINKITKIVCDKFGAENRHERDGNVLVFNEEYLTKMQRIYGTEKKIQAKLVECEPCEPCEPPWKSQKAYYVPIDSKNSDDLSTDLPEITSADLESASHDSHDSQQYPQDCYYCKEYFDGIGKEAYQKHVLSRHPEKPCYPGLSDIKKHSLVAKGMWWEI